MYNLHLMQKNNDSNAEQLLLDISQMVIVYVHFYKWQLKAVILQLQHIFRNALDLVSYRTYWLH